MKNILDYLNTVEGLREARKHEFELDGRRLGRFSAFFIYENRLCFSRNRAVNEIPFYLSDGAGSYGEGGQNPLLQHIRQI